MMKDILKIKKNNFLVLETSLLCTCVHKHAHIHTHTQIHTNRMCIQKYLKRSAIYGVRISKHIVNVNNNEKRI